MRACVTGSVLGGASMSCGTHQRTSAGLSWSLVRVVRARSRYMGESERTRRNALREGAQLAIGDLAELDREVCEELLVALVEAEPAKQLTVVD